MRGEPPTFLARRGYRERRLGDAARALPFVGGALFLVPLAWRPETGGAPTLPAWLYLFGVWVVLLVVAAIVARALGRATETSEADPPEERS